MPEHVHVLVNEPENGTLAQALQSLKQGVARRLALRAADPFWQAQYYDFNVWSERKFVEKLRYIHRDPVKRVLVLWPEDWAWSSFRHYLSGQSGPVEIESRWTARERERARVFPTVRVAPQKPPAQAELGRGTLENRDARDRPGCSPAVDLSIQNQISQSLAGVTRGILIYSEGLAVSLDRNC
jgi:hypothetical protein